MTYLAIDFGGGSGRVIAGTITNEGGQKKLLMQLVHRFPNRQVRLGDHVYWDFPALFADMKTGLRKAAALGLDVAGIGIDTWGVDFGLIDSHGDLIGNPVCYRDARTEGMADRFFASTDRTEHYAVNGTQVMEINTLFQLLSLKEADSPQLKVADRLLFTPDLFSYFLTGEANTEYTIASTSEMLDARKRQWDWPLIDRLGLPRRIFGELRMPGTALGGFTKAVQEAVGFDAQVVLPATHDTGSAFLAVPARDDRAVYISSGTWSLLGVENDAPITTPASQAANFTNEGGAWYRFRYLKNIMGLWMVQSIRRELNGVAYVEGKARAASWTLADHEPGRTYSFADLEAAAKAAAAFTGTVDVNDARFLAPDSMIAEVVAAADVKPATVGELVQCVYRSLARCYADAIRHLSALTGKTYTSVNIVGGGSKDGYLNALTAQATGLDVFAGPTEGTAIGNLIVQFIAGGEFPDLAAARAAVRASLDVTRV